MFSFLRKKSLVKRVAQGFTQRVTLVGAVLVLLTSFFFVSCVEPDDSNSSTVNAKQPSIATQPANTFWNVFNDTDENGVKLTVSAAVTDGGNLSYQWYSNSTNSNSGGTTINGATSNEFTLTKTAYTANGAYYFYVIVTNTNSAVSGTKTASVTSDSAVVTIVGYPDTDYSDTHTMPENLKGEWESEWGELFTISATEFSSGGDWGEGWSGYKGTIITHRGNAAGTAGYITIQYTQNDWAEGAENLYYVIYYKDLTDTTVTISGAGSSTDPDFGAGGGRSNKEEAEATYTVSAGYFEMGSDLEKTDNGGGVNTLNANLIGKWMDSYGYECITITADTFLYEAFDWVAYMEDDDYEGDLVPLWGGNIVYIENFDDANGVIIIEYTQKQVWIDWTTYSPKADQPEGNFYGIYFSDLTTTANPWTAKIFYTSDQNNDFGPTETETLQEAIARFTLTNKDDWLSSDAGTAQNKVEE